MANDDNIFFDLRLLTRLGKGAIIGKTVRIRKPARVSIGDYSILDDFTYISCGLTVGDYTHIGASSTLIGGEAHITIGDFVNIAPGCRLVAATNDSVGGGLVGPAIPPEFASKSILDNITIADHALFGADTVVLPGTHVPEGVSTGAMTLLTPKLDLKPWTLYVGIPARPLKRRESREILEAANRLRASEKRPA